jgi:hypothetical protein
VLWRQLRHVAWDRRLESNRGAVFCRPSWPVRNLHFASPVRDVDIYIGSLDDENSLTINFGGGSFTTYTGDDLAAGSGQSTPIPGGAPTIFGAMTNGLWTFTDPSLDIVSITLSEGGTAISSNSFGVAEILTSVPEPSTSAMMLLGFAGLGLVSYRQRQKLAGVASV